METKTPPSPPYDWLKTISPSLTTHDEIPLLGAAPPFPWEKFTEQLAERFEMPNLHTEASSWQWRSSDELTNGLGSPIRAIHFSVNPLDGTGCLLFPEEHITVMMGWFLQNDPGILALPEGDYKEAFLHFCIMEALFNYQQVYEEKTLTPVLSAETALPNNDALCADITLHYNDNRIIGRLAITPQLRKAWKEHFVSGPPPATAAKISEEATVTLSAECGKVAMTLPEWQQLNTGDLLVLDSCTVQPPPRGSNSEAANTTTGQVTLTIHGRPVFSGTIEENKLKIIDYAVTMPDDTSAGVEAMDDFASQPEEEEEEENGEFDEFEDEFDDDDDEDADTDSDKEESADNGEEDDATADTDSDEEESTNNGEDDATANTDSDEKEAVAEATAAPAKAANPIKPEEAPLNITVEVARFQMNVKGLMQLQPGNLLELDARPETGVDLVVNGRKVAHGELIKVGDVLGVRILDLGK